MRGAQSYIPADISNLLFYKADSKIFMFEQLTYSVVFIVGMYGIQNLRHVRTVRFQISLTNIEQTPIVQQISKFSSLEMLNL